jgi:plasmid maintenance system antidote protein VapI
MKELSKDSKFSISIETLGALAVALATVIGMWYSLQSEIELAKELPQPEVSRTEYDLKDQLIRETIMNTQNKVEENGDKLDKIEERLYEIR